MGSGRSEDLSSSELHFPVCHQPATFVPGADTQAQGSFDIDCQAHALHVAHGLLKAGADSGVAERVVNYLRMWWPQKSFQFTPVVQYILAADGQGQGAGLWPV